MTTTQATPAQLAKQPWTAVIGYGLGDWGCNLGFSMSTQFLLLYYTDVALLSAASMATMFLIVRLWDAFADIIAGSMVDKTETRWGKFRPWIFGMGIPMLFLSALTFNVPTKGQKWMGLFMVTSDVSVGTKTLYAYLTYAILGFAYSLTNIPYGSLASAMTQSIKERAKLVASRNFGSTIGGLFLTYLIAPLINGVKAVAPKFKLVDGAYTNVATEVTRLNGAYAKAGKSIPEIVAGATDKAIVQAYTDSYQQALQTIFTTVTLWFVLLGGLFFFLTALWCRESVVRKKGAAKEATAGDLILTIKTNTALQFLCAAAFFYLLGLFSTSGATAYYAQWVLGSITHLPTIALVNSGISLLMTPIVPALINKFGKKLIFQFCGVFTVVGGGSLWFVPPVKEGAANAGSSLVLALICLGIKGVGASLINTVMFGLGADVVEYGEWKTGKRTEGATYSIYSFTRKITQSLGGAISGYLLQWTGYLAGAALAANGGVQPESAIDGIRFMIGPIPAICAVLAMIAFIKFPMDDKLYYQIREENEARKLAQANAEVAKA